MLAAFVSRSLVRDPSLHCRAEDPQDPRTRRTLPTRPPCVRRTPSTPPTSEVSLRPASRPRPPTSPRPADQVGSRAQRRDRRTALGRAPPSASCSSSYSTPCGATPKARPRHALSPYALGPPQSPPRWWSHSTGYPFAARSAASTQLLRRVATVMGPTPPGTGVIQPATSRASSKRTSPTSPARPSTLL